MRVVVDENISLRIVPVLRAEGHEVIAIAETAGKGTPDSDGWEIVCRQQALLVTRDHHFTNPLRYSASDSLGIIFIRHGNLTSSDEALLIHSFIHNHPLQEYRGKLVTLSPGAIRIL